MGKSVLGSVVDQLLGFLFDGLDLGSVGQVVVEEQVLDVEDAILLLSHVLDLGSGPVGDAGVGHRVAVVPVGLDVEHDGAVFGAPFLGELEGFSDGEDVEAVDGHSGDVKSLVELSVVGGSLDGGTHAVGVVLAYVDGGEVPETGHVGSLDDLALVGGSISIEDSGDVLLLSVLEGEGKSGSDWDLSSHDTVTPVEVGSVVVVVHRASFSLGRSPLDSQHLAEDLVDTNASLIGLTVHSVSRDEGVIPGDSFLHSLGDGLLAIIKMAEPVDQLIFVEVVTDNLHTSHDAHLPQVVD